MQNSFLQISKSMPLRGTVALTGAKNAVLVIMASLLLTRGKSILYNVPRSADVLHMITLLQELGIKVCFDEKKQALYVDTTGVCMWKVSPEIMGKMRASILVMGPLLALFGKAEIAMPGGCVIGSRPIDLHLFGFVKMGVTIFQEGEFLCAKTSELTGATIVLDYPSVGATENIMMAAVTATGITRIVNAALEPEVMDLIAVLQKMGARISVFPPATIEIQGGFDLHPIEHTIIMDRLEAGALLLAAAITGGRIDLPDAPAFAMEAVIAKLEQMGHAIVIGQGGIGVSFIATNLPQAVSFKTGPYPAFPTDLQAPMMALQCVARGVSVITETVFENRFVHIPELQKMGATISVQGNTATVTGVVQLKGTRVTASDIRASCALMLAGLVAQGSTMMEGVSHWRRGYDNLEHKLRMLGADVTMHDGQQGIGDKSDKAQLFVEILKNNCVSS